MAKKTEKEITPKAKTRVKKQLTQEELEKAAYYRWLDRGCPHGDEMSDWLEAEKYLTK